MITNQKKIKKTSKKESDRNIVHYKLKLTKSFCNISPFFLKKKKKLEINTAVVIIVSAGTPIRFGIVCRYVAVTLLYVVIEIIVVYYGNIVVLRVVTAVVTAVVAAVTAPSASGVSYCHFFGQTKNTSAKLDIYIYFLECCTDVSQSCSHDGTGCQSYGRFPTVRRSRITNHYCICSGRNWMLLLILDDIANGRNGRLVIQCRWYYLEMDAKLNILSTINWQYDAFIFIFFFFILL